jgi:tetratricopeptide (TPR) repeat protein
VARASIRVFVAAGWLASSAWAADSSRGHASVAELSTQIDEVAKAVKVASDNLRLVERQYSQVAEPSDDAARMQRFSDGEINYLLGDYGNAAVLFYDLIASKEFQANRSQYADALFYLSDSLYQQKNYLGARLYLRQLLSLRGGHYKEALARYLEIAGRLNEFSGIDEYINQAKGLSGGELPPELTYVYAKWLFRREDLSLDQRIPRAQGAFGSLVQAAGGPFRLQSGYFIGVGFVKLKNYEKAIEQFKWVASQPTRDAKEKQVRELANLSLGRVLFEIGKYDEAIDRYQEIARESENFPDSLYETAWTYVRKADYQRAKNATEVLLLVAEDSVLAPEARILQGTLLLKLQRYEEAAETYNSVINAYAPVRDEIDALLAVKKDPVAYFDDLLARNSKNLDVTSLLPPVALKWATTRREVAEAVDIINALEAGRHGVEDGQQIANRILKALDERGLETFPVMQEGYTRADAVETAITRAEESLTRIEGYLVGTYLSPEQKALLEKARNEAQSLQERISTLPTTADEVQARKDRIRTKIEEVDQIAFRLGVEIQSQYAQMTAIQKYVDDTRQTRKNTPEDEKAFLEKVSFERRALDAVQADLDKTRQQLAEEKHNAENAIGGDESLKRDYEAAMKRERELFEQVRGVLPSEGTQVMLRADVVRADAEGVKERITAAKKTLRDRVQRRAEKLRATVLAEQAQLDGYGKEVATISGDARNLVGRIAFDSFKRVRQSFYDLVLKADVGVVDVAFTRKQDKTAQIQKLAGQKDRELHQLDDEFKEVLKDVE